MRNGILGVLVASILAPLFVYLSKLISDIWFKANIYYVFLFLIMFLIWTVIVCTFLLIDALNKK